MGLLARIALALARWSERWVPGSFSIACILTIITFSLGMVLAKRTLLQCIGYWADGFWVLLEFAMQMALIVITGYVVAVSPPVSRALDRLSRLPRTPRGSIALAALASMLLAWLHWGLGLIGGAILVRFIAGNQRGIDYRLLVAVAYFGLGATWHAGPSGSAPLLIATPGHFLEQEIGVVPLSATIFTRFNLLLVLVIVIVLTALAPMFHPARREDILAVEPEAVKRLASFAPPKPQANPKRSLALLADYSYALNLVLGGLGLAWLIHSFATAGPSLSLNNLNFAFLIAGLLLHPSPASFVKAAEEATSLVHGIIIQFPLYAGMYGIIKGSGLYTIIGGWFVSVAKPETFPAIVYWYSAVLNYFVPSGGSKWAIEAPYIIAAGRELNVPVTATVLAYAWGDMLTNLLQPFWAIPLLAAARLEFKEIIGYEAIVFVACAIIVSLAFILFPPI